MVRSSTPELRAFFRPSPPPDANMFWRSMAISVSISGVVLLSCASFNNLVRGWRNRGEMALEEQILSEIRHMTFKCIVGKLQNVHVYKIRQQGNFSSVIMVSKQLQLNELFTHFASHLGRQM